MKKYIILITLVASLFVCSCKKKEQVKVSIPPTPAVLVKAEGRTVSEYISTLGTTASKCSVNIVPQVSGQIVAVNFKQGDFVKKGQVLAVIDKRPYESAVKQAEGQLRQSKAQLKIDELQVERNRKLAKDNYVDKQTFDSLVAKVEVDKGIVEANEATLETAKINLAWCDITAPVDGKLGLYNIDLGNVVSAGTSVITTIEQVDSLYVDFAIPSQRLYDAQQLMKKNNGKLDITVEYIEDNMSHLKRKTSVSIVLNKMRYETGTAILRAELDNKDFLFWPNQPVRVIFDLQKIDAVLVPDICVNTNKVGPYVYVATPYKSGVYIVKQVQINKGQLYDKNVLRAIKGDVKAGDFVVRDVNQLRLQAGPYVYNATPQGLIIGEDGKPITSPEAMKKFMVETGKIADALRAEMIKKMQEMAIKASAPTQALQKARAEAEAPVVVNPKK